MIQQTSTAVLAVAVATSAVTGESVVTRLAPENAVVIAGAMSPQATLDRFKQTAMWRLWQTEQMQDLLTWDDGESLEDVLEEMYEELGVPEGSLVPPTGEVAFAMYGAVDEELGAPQAAFLAFADYGEAAGKTDALLRAALEKGERDGELDWEEDELDGWTVVSIELTEDPDPEAGMGDDFPMGGGMPGFVPDADDIMEQVTRMHYSRRGDAFVFGSEREGLRQALHRLDDEDTEGLAAREDYRTVRRLIGECDGFAVLLTRDLMSLLGGFDDSGMLMLMQPTLRSAFGEISAYGFGMRMESEEAMSEGTLAIVMPNGKSGLPALMDLPEPRGALPAFVGPDTISYSRMNFRFEGLKDFVTNLVQSNPLLQMQLAEAMPQIEATIDQIGAALGSEVHVVESMRRPIALETVQSLFAVQCTNAEQFENLLGTLGPQMGMEPRDFLGHRLFVMGEGGGMGMGMGADAAMAVGIGGGYVLVGQQATVESALRGVGERDRPGLDGEDAFARASALLPDAPAVMWGYSSTVDVMEGREVMNRLLQEAMLEQMAEEFPDFAEEMRQEMAAEAGPEVDFDLIRRYVGPTVWHIHSTDDGFVGRFFVLPGEEE